MTVKIGKFDGSDVAAVYVNDEHVGDILRHAACRRVSWYQAFLWSDDVVLTEDVRDRSGVQLQTPTRAMQQLRRRISDHFAA